MAFYLLAEYTHHGYHDSYFYDIIFDDEAVTITDKMIGATAFAGGRIGSYEPLSDVIVKQVREYFTGLLCDHYMEVETRICLTPPIDALAPGVAVRTTRVIRGTDRATRGKIQIPADSVAHIVSHPRAFGTFYRNGANRPNRDNARVLIEVQATGQRAYVACNALRMDYEAPTPSGIRPAAVEVAKRWPLDLLFPKVRGLTANHILTFVRNRSETGHTLISSSGSFT
ncbi:MAG: hypothetical protein PF961_14035 [Planctomycetota bacterium]|jgi:hypothetical protein|nr:hypothetical protein [Planctomycetota bacterium]